MSTDHDKIRITWDDVEKAEDIDPIPVAQLVAEPAHTTGGRPWGSISPQTNPVQKTEASSGSVLLKGWFYLGSAGLLGSFLAWMFCEPSFSDVATARGWGNTMLVPLVSTLMCVSLGMVESLVERSWQRAIMRGLAAVGLGLVLGFIFSIVADKIFYTVITILIKFGVTSNANPAFWLGRSLAWLAFGMAGGLIFGIVSKSGKKTSYGILGGAIGAAVGGLLFDPITLLTGGAEASRAIGFSLLGASTGIAIGLVESALKERWLYVSSGPLAGKQFVLYQDLVTIGRSQSCTIYLFKDPEILEQHATIERRAGKSLLTAYGPVVVSGQTLQERIPKVLRSGDILQMGRYTFSYAEKERTAKA